MDARRPGCRTPHASRICPASGELVTGRYKELSLNTENFHADRPGRLLNRWSQGDVIRFMLPVLAFALAAAAVAAVLTLRQPTEYESGVTAVMQTSEGPNDTEVLMRTMMALVNGEVVGEALRAQVDSPLSVDAITGNLTVERPPGSSVMTIHYTDTDRDRSVRTAQAILPVFDEQISALEASQAGQLAPNYAIRPWGNGSVITTEVPPPVQRNAAVAALLGALIGGIGSALYRQRNPYVHTSEDAGRASGLPVVATPWGLKRSSHRRSHWHPIDVIESVITRLPDALGERELPRRLLVVVPDAGHQPAAFMTHFARALQHRGGQATLVDADLEHGSLSRELGLERRRGLADSLRSDESPTKVIVVPDKGDAAGLPVLPAGRKLPLRAGSAAMVIADLDREGHLIISSPALSTRQSLGPLIRSADAVILLTIAGSSSMARTASLAALVRSIGQAPATTVLLADRAADPSLRGTPERPLVPHPPSRAAWLKS